MQDSTLTHHKHFRVAKGELCLLKRSKIITSDKQKEKVYRLSLLLGKRLYFMLNRGGVYSRL